MKEMTNKPRLTAYLPAIFQKQIEQEGDPLKALIAICEHFFSGIEERIDGIEAYFDPYQTPRLPDRRGQDFLTWLASWVALDLDERWSEKKKRYLVKNAARLYKYRGTLTGLKYIIEEFFDIEVDIKEWTWPPGMQIGMRSSIGLDTQLIEKIDIDHCFMVIWKPPRMDRDNRINLIRKIRRIIDLEKPAHTQCYFHLEFPKEKEPEIPYMIIGMSSTIGLCFID